MFAMHRQIDRVKAERMLEGIQVNGAQHMKAHDHRTFIDRLVERCRAIVSEAAPEMVHWNGSVMRSARAIKGKVVEAFGREAVA